VSGFDRAQAAYDAQEPPDPRDDDAYEAGWTDALAQALAVVDKGGRAETAIQTLIDGRRR